MPWPRCAARLRGPSSAARRSAGRGTPASHRSAGLPGRADSQRPPDDLFRAILRRLGPRRSARSAAAHRHRGALRLRQLRDGTGATDRSRESRRPRGHADAHRRHQPPTARRGDLDRSRVRPGDPLARRSRRDARGHCPARRDGREVRSPCSTTTGGHPRRASAPWSAAGAGSTASTYPNDLRWVQMPLATDAACQGSWAAQGADTSVMVCAGMPNRTPASGTAAGRSWSRSARPRGSTLHGAGGIVSYGDLACNGSPPGVYTRVASSAIQSYLSQANPVSAPRNTSPPVVDGTLAVGQTITCAPGGWDGAPALDYQFVRGLDDRTTVRADEPRRAEQLRREQRGRRQPAGLLRQGAQRRRTGLQAERVDGHRPRSAGTRAAQSVDQPAPSQNQQDIAAPVARITETTCTATRCTLTVTVTDAGSRPGSRPCRPPCARPTAAAASARAATRPSPARSTARSSRASRRSPPRTSRSWPPSCPTARSASPLVAIDKAGHRQALPTTKTVKTKKPRKHR